MKPATRESSKIIQQAVRAHTAETGSTMRTISASAGFDKPNYLSMLTTTDRVALAKIPDLKRAMPCLDQEALTAAVLTEMFPDPAAHEAILALAKYVLAEPPLEQAVLKVTAEFRVDVEASGLSLPDTLDETAAALIVNALRQLAQRHTAATHEM